MNDVTTVLHVLKLAYITGVVIMLCICFIKPYWLISADEWEALLERQHEKHPTIKGRTETAILCFSHVLLSLVWPLVCYILLLERLRA